MYKFMCQLVVKPIPKANQKFILNKKNSKLRYSNTLE